MSNPKFPKKAREGKMIWKMDEEDRQQKISQVDKNWNQTKYPEKHLFWGRVNSQLKMDITTTVMMKNKVR